MYQAGSECRKCLSPCNICSGRDTCIFCSEGNFLHDDVCIGACPLGYRGEPVIRQCVPCNEGCRLCTDKVCLQCEESLYLVEDEGTCMQTCPDGTVAKTDAHGFGKCHSCYHTCRTCSDIGATDCTSCFEDESVNDGECRAIPSQQDESGDQAASGSEGNEAGAIVYAGVAIGAIAVIVLAAIAIGLLRQRRQKHILETPQARKRSTFEISNPTYMISNSYSHAASENTQGILIYLHKLLLLSTLLQADVYLTEKKIHMYIRIYC